MTLDALGTSLNARAAGLWEVRGGRLLQVEFWAAPELDPEIARGFREATLAVPLDRVDLGIVAAVAEGRPRVSIAKLLPADAGSGLWLRKFGADRSIAVPCVREGRAVGVASIAVDGEVDEARAIAELQAFLADEF